MSIGGYIHKHDFLCTSSSVKFLRQTRRPIGARISDYIGGVMAEIIELSMPLFQECIAWISNYIPLFCMDVITHSWPYPNVGLANVVK